MLDSLAADKHGDIQALVGPAAVGHALERWRWGVQDVLWAAGPDRGHLLVLGVRQFVSDLQLEGQVLSSNQGAVGRRNQEAVRRHQGHFGG